MILASYSLKDLVVAKVPDSYWRLLNSFNVYRLLVALILLLAAGWYGAEAVFGASNPTQFFQINAIYLCDALLCLAAPYLFKTRFNLHLTVGVLIDTLALTLLMNNCGGGRSGIGYLLLVVVAGAGLVGQGRLTLLYAAMATFAVLFEQLARVLLHEAEPAGFFRAGMTSLGFFGIGLTALLLARRIAANEALAALRGKELSDQFKINQSVIRDMEQGVLVVDKRGLIQQTNPQAEKLLEAKIAALAELGEVSAFLAEHYPTWRHYGQEVTAMFRSPNRARLLHVRFLQPDPAGNALLYLEDMEKVHAHAQQIKLAALGRLTANMAHEIRNPLAAISHAAELLGEEHRDATHERLTRMIGENAQRLNRLVDDILELGRRDRARSEPIRVRELVEGLVDELALRDDGVRRLVEISINDGSIIVFDRGHLYRALSNLVQNAMRYCRNRPASVRVELKSDGGGVVELHVSDDGPGIADAQRGQIFEPFFTTSAGGTGLGLYIARELCEANGASLVFVGNTPGAHFRISGAGSE